MANELTLSIIKPDGVEKGIIGRVVSRFESNGLKPIAMKMKLLSKTEAEGFYAVHKARPFFNDLGTIRKDFATDIEKNTVHGSDSAENAKIEVSYFFPEIEILRYEWKNKK
jgi:nucleoside-diphosphate kinase